MAIWQLEKGQLQTYDRGREAQFPWKFEFYTIQVFKFFTGVWLNFIPEGFIPGAVEPGDIIAVGCDHCEIIQQ